MTNREEKAQRLAGGNAAVERALLAGERVPLSLLDPYWVSLYGLKKPRPDYHTYLNSPEWRTMRKRAFNHYGYLCNLCGRDDHLNVHHRTYERLGHERLSDLTILCQDCHAAHHHRLAS